MSGAHRPVRRGDVPDWSVGQRAEGGRLVPGRVRAGVLVAVGGSAVSASLGMTIAELVSGELAAAVMVAATLIGGLLVACIVVARLPRSAGRHRLQPLPRQAPLQSEPRSPLFGGAGAKGHLLRMPDRASGERVGQPG